MKLFTMVGMAMLLAACTQAQVPPAEEQITAALLAAPTGSAEAATVIGYVSTNRTSTLREGTNEFVCLADNPAREGFEVVCYHKDLDPYMARGRELRNEGIGGQENIAQRQAEIEAGTLAWPDHPSTLYILYGEEGAFNVESGTAETANLRYVIYTPYATGESTGLSEAPTVPGAPWLMSAGTFRAHIMVTPPAPEN